MFYVYVIKSKIDGSHYTGLTADINRRYKEHNLGKNYSTKSKKPGVLIFTQEVFSRKEARELEKYLKSGYGRELILEIEGYLTTEYIPL